MELKFIIYYLNNITMPLLLQLGIKLKKIILFRVIQILWICP